MSATEDEAKSLDAGWDDEEPAEEEVDQAWDSLPPPVSGPVSAAMPSMAPATEEVDEGWDDVPEGAPQPSSGVAGKKRPHRQRRAKSTAVAVSSSPVLMPRPAEPSKKHQREHARKQRAHEALVKQQRKDEKKAQRVVDAREEAAARLRQTEAEELARRERREERERTREKAPPKAARPKRAEAPKNGEKKTPSSAVELKEKAPLAHKSAPKSGLRPGVLVTLVVLAVAVALLVLRK